MGQTGWFYVAFMAVVVMIVLTVWAAMVLEAGERPPGRAPDAATQGHEPGETNAPERRAALAFSTPPPSPLQGGSTLAGYPGSTAGHLGRSVR